MSAVFRDVGRGLVRDDAHKSSIFRSIHLFELPWGSAQTQSLADADAYAWRHWLKVLSHAKSIAVALGVVHASIERGFDPHLQKIRSIHYSPGQLGYDDDVRGGGGPTFQRNGSPPQRVGTAFGSVGAGTFIDPRAAQQGQS